jgi:hypothetical protein
MCATCKKVLQEEKFIRNYKTYKTCNQCCVNSSKYKDKYTHKRKIELDARMMEQLKNMYRAVKSRNKLRMKDCAKEIYKFTKYRNLGGETLHERLLLDISEAWKNQDKQEMTKTLYTLILYIEKNISCLT